MEHTKEPWVTAGESSDKGWLTQIINSKCAIVSDANLSEENARRIVACVNACQRHSTEILEAVAACGGIPEEPAIEVQESREKIDRLTKQRDELLRTIDMTYKMLLSESDTKGALFKAENLLWAALDYVKEVK